MFISQAAKSRQSAIELKTWNQFCALNVDAEQLKKDRFRIGTERDTTLEDTSLRKNDDGECSRWKRAGFKSSTDPETS